MVSARHRSSPGGDGRDYEYADPDGTGGGPLSGLARPRTIRGRLARILIFSLVLVLALLGVTIAGQVGNYTDAGTTVSSVSLALSVQDFVQQAQRERGLTNGLLGGETRFQQTLMTQRTATDKALTALNTALASSSAPGASSVRDALGRFGALVATREAVDSRRADRNETFQFYTDGIAALNGLQLGLDQAQDPQLRHGLQALYALGDAKEYTGQERGFLNGVFAAGKFGPGEYVHFTEIRADKQAGLTSFQRNATTDQQDLLNQALASDNAAKSTAAENTAIASTKGPVDPAVDPVGWWSWMTAVIDSERKVQQSVGNDLTQRAQVLQGQAATTLTGFLVVALLAVVAEVLLVISCMRSIIRPLAALSTEANDVATRRLPAAVAAWHAPGDVEPEAPQPVRTPPKGGAEIASVARALDRVQTTAFELASEQALVRRNTTESLANLGRRNQNLVRRQLNFISEFEREELDPSALANLFELDHLATRMRRNAESLLVLVGETSPRRWAEPLALSDVIRAGLSEVEDYRRVMLRRVDDAMIVGAVVTELAHMLAELIENGLAFSPPDLEVEIYGRRLGNGYMLAVVDHGVGMPKEQLAKANARLRGEEDFIVAPTRFLGHYVVGRLAQRLGVEVELTVSPVSGVVARMLLPLDILADTSKPAVEPKPAPPKPAAPPEPVQPAETNGIAWPSAEPEPPSIESTGVQPMTVEQQPAAPVVRTRQERLSITPQPVSKAPAVAPEQRTGDAPVQRTKNGLVKRNRARTDEPVTASRPPTAPAATMDNRSPDEVRSMLSSFRSGHQRGERGPLPTRTSSIPEEEHR